MTIDAHLAELQTSMNDYAGFNLLLGQVDASAQVQLGFLSNRSNHLDQAVDGKPAHGPVDCVRQLQDGSPYGVMSNGALACSINDKATDALRSAWPKMQTGSEAFQKAVASHAGSASDDHKALVNSLFDVLR